MWYVVIDAYSMHVCASKLILSFFKASGQNGTSSMDVGIGIGLVLPVYSDSYMYTSHLTASLSLNIRRAINDLPVMHSLVQR